MKPHRLGRLLALLLLAGASLACFARWTGPLGSDALLRATPMVGRPTADSITLTVIAGDRPLEITLGLKAEASGAESWSPVAFGPAVPAEAAGGGVRVPGALVAADASSEPLSLAADTYLEMELSGLAEGTAYRYQLTARVAFKGDLVGRAIPREEHRGRLVTQRPRGASFTFVVFSDPHFFVPELGPTLPREAAEDPLYLQYSLEQIQWFRETRDRVAAEFGIVARNMNRDRPDFAVGLGDHFDLHGLDFNAAFLTASMAETAHKETRHQFGQLNRVGALFQILGNWEGESGFHAPEHRTFAISARKRYTVNPRPSTSQPGGSADEDYYAFSWGDVLLVALNVRGYTPTRHLLGDAGSGEGGPEDFTLGAAQREFLAQTLTTSDHPYKVLLIHHAVGGRGGDYANSAYGRGGGRAARVGEQEWVHELMLRHGVQIFFYGHDHVFTDIEVEGIHYTLPGTTGAPWRFSEAETGYEKYWKESGHARVQVTPEEMRVEFVSFEGKVLYSYEVLPF